MISNVTKKDLLNKMSETAPTIVRLSISLVVLWFGINQVINPEKFMGYLPSFLLMLDYAKNLVLFNGIFEIIFGTLLLIGLFVRPVALILAVHLLSITLNLGYNDIAVRDFGLTLITIAVFLGGADKWSLDYQREKKRIQQ